MSSITLYSSSECVRCQLVKQMLNKHNVKYIEINDRQIVLNKDLESVPALEVDGQLIDSYQMILYWLRENGYYSL